MRKLKISENGRYFTYEDGTPFIWLADTAWTLAGRLKWDDVECYLKTRKAQGFTVLQMVVLDPEFNQQMQDPSGDPALIDGDLLKPNEAYFKYLDYVLDRVEAYGFYVLLLPAWGQLVVGDDWAGGVYPKTVTEENAYSYGKWIGARMRGRNNILWCLGGDRMPIHKGTDYRMVWRRMAEGLASGYGGMDLKYQEQHEQWMKMPITYHACREAETGLCSTFSYWTDEEAWISFIMLQSGHGLGVKNYELVMQEYQRKNVMPVWDGEPAYEMMPTSWPITDKTAFHQSEAVRQRMYFSLFAGAFGFTYGHSCVWCMISEKERSAFLKNTWYEAIHSEGSRQMKILRDFLEACELQKFIPCQQILLRQSAQAEEADLYETHEQACCDPAGRKILVYFAKDTSEKIDVSVITDSENDKPLYAAWFNPATGETDALFVPEAENGVISVKNDAADSTTSSVSAPAGPAGTSDSLTAPAGASSSGAPAAPTNACDSLTGPAGTSDSLTGPAGASSAGAPAGPNNESAGAAALKPVPDRILMIAADPEVLRVPCGVYGEESESGEAKKVFEW